MIAALLATAALALTPAQAAASQPQTTATSPALAERAMRLAAILNSEAVIIGDAKSDAQALEYAQQLMNSQEDMRELEKDMPGFMLAFAREILPIVDKSARERLPELHRRQAALYASTFTAAELDTLIDFYGSPTGSKLIVMMDSVKPDAMLTEAAKSEDFTFTAPSALQDIRAATPHMLKAMDETDKAALAKFATSGVAPKLRAMAPQTQTIAIQWMNEEAPWEAAETERAFEQLLARYENRKKKQ